VDLSRGGVRFRLFPKPPYAHPAWPAETICVSSVPGSIGPGPSDDRIVLKNPVDKGRGYGVSLGPLGTPHLILPPWRGSIYPPVRPDADGHFDTIEEGTREFEDAHVFGTVRFVLDIWERYFGRPIEWHFARDFDRLEIVLLPTIDNAYVGYGFMEVGAHHAGDGSVVPYALNFDVMAHELGHLIIYSTIGVPSPTTQAGEYYGFQESAADATALVAVLHFESLIERLLEETHGNLYTFNELNRFAELSSHDQIRLATNSMKMSDFAAGWEDEHALSQPLTGALFDIGVDIFQEMLVDRGLITRDVAELSREVRTSPDRAERIQPFFDDAYPTNYDGFRGTLADARDYMGLALAQTWGRLSPDFFSYENVAAELMLTELALSGGRYQRAFAESFEWREIGRVSAGARLRPPNRNSHTFSPRTLVPTRDMCCPRMSYRERAMMTGLTSRTMRHT
jgi:hypothetical protein